MRIKAFKWDWIMSGLVFGLIGPLLRLLSISQSTLENVETGIFWAKVDIYLWPAHLLAWGGGAWGLFAIVANVLLFIAVAFFVLRTIGKRRLRFVLLLVVVLWALLIASFLAGFRLDEISQCPLVIGISFYVGFVFATDLIIRINRHSKTERF